MPTTKPPEPRAASPADDLEVEEVIGQCAACGEPLVASDPENPSDRWSGYDGTFLPRICPRCRKSYDPDRPATFDPADPRGRKKRKVAGELLWAVVAAGWVILGRALFTMPGAGGGRGAAAGAAAIGVVLAVYVFLPWLFTAVLLCLIALRDRIDHLAPKLAAGAILGLLVCTGLSPAALLAGVILGPLAALVLRWRELNDGG